mmetsp:Transcript_10214/g.20429  ORF Transcript_10214/g.20429 Transcript_10214/m.20429 type:complete len:339 (-) Transcript_10214:2787-3803(-)
MPPAAAAAPPVPPIIPHARNPFYPEWNGNTEDLHIYKDELYNWAFRNNMIEYALRATTAQRNADAAAAHPAGLSNAQKMVDQKYLYGAIHHVFSKHPLCRHLFLKVDKTVNWFASDKYHECLAAVAPRNVTTAQSLKYKLEQAVIFRGEFTKWFTNLREIVAKMDEQNCRPTDLEVYNDIEQSILEYIETCKEGTMERTTWSAFLSDLRRRPPAAGVTLDYLRTEGETTYQTILDFRQRRDYHLGKRKGGGVSAFPAVSSDFANRELDAQFREVEDHACVGAQETCGYCGMVGHSRNTCRQWAHDVRLSEQSRRNRTPTPERGRPWRRSSSPGRRFQG